METKEERISEKEKVDSDVKGSGGDWAEKEPLDLLIHSTMGGRKKAIVTKKVASHSRIQIYEYMYVMVQCEDMTK